jgi:hypothetical protein
MGHTPTVTKKELSVSLCVFVRRFTSGITSMSLVGEGRVWGGGLGEYEWM